MYKILTVEAILENPRYGIALRDAALTLIAMHDVSPRIVRYTADLKRWLLTQAILAFHFERVTAPTRPGLTAASLLAFIAENRIVSKNTAVAHLAEMRHYGLLLDTEQTEDKRLRRLKIADIAEALIREWFDGHLKSLDMLDHGSRFAQSSNNQQLLWHAQPRMSRRLFEDPSWSAPPETVEAFVRTASGSNILHDLMSRLPPEKIPDTKASIGPLRVGDLAKRYIISRSHAQRVLARARALNIVGWEHSGTAGDFWISETLVRHHRRWQAAKFAAIDEAFHWALHRRGDEGR